MRKSLAIVSSLFFLHAIGLAFSAEALTCSEIFTPTRGLIEVLHDRARVENLAIGIVTAEEMRAFEPDLSVAARLVAQELKSVAGSNAVRTVLYPAAGFDAATAFRVFDRS